MKNGVLSGKPSAGNPHVWFDEGEVTSAKPRRRSQLYKDRIRKALVLLTGVVGMFTANAEVSFTELTDQSVLSETEAGLSTQYSASTSLTIKLSGTATDGVFTLMPSFYIPEGVTLTVDGSGVSGLTTIRMKGGLRGIGTVAFGAGITKLVFGAAPTLTNIIGDKNKMVALEADVAFAEAGGAVEIVEGVSLVRWPTCSYKIAEGTVVAVMGANLFTENTLTLDTWDLVLCHQNAIKKGCTITVSEGRTLYHRPSYLYTVDSKSAGHVQTWAGQSDYTHELNVLLDGGAFCTQSKTVGNTILGDLSGTGVLALKGKGELTFEGCVTFAGEVNVSSKDCDQNTLYTFRTTSGSTLANAAFSLTDGNFCSLSFEPQGGSALAVGSVSGNSDVPVFSIGAGCTVNIGTLTGAIGISGLGAGAKAVVAEAVPPLSLYPGVMLSIPTCDLANPIVLAPATGTVSGNAWGLEVRAETAQPVRFDFADLGSDAEITLGGKVALTQMLPVSMIRIASGAEVKAPDGPGPKIVNEGGTLEIVESWKAKAALWTDASLASSFTSAKAAMADRYGPTDKSLSYLKDEQVAEWRDCRADRQEYRIRTTVFDGSGAAAPTSTSAKSFPYLQDQDGKPSAYFSTNGSRARMYIATGIGANATLPVKCAVFAFNGALGGGNALFWAENNAFKRVETVSGNNYPTKDAPLVYSNDKGFAFRQDGTAVEDCTSTGLKAGWQILSFTCENGISIGALGPGKSENTGSDNGGQIFGEVIFFTEMPTENEILAMEKYLADKWNVTIVHAGGERPTCSVSGTGTVKLTEDASFDTTGYFAGTVDLNGKRMEIGEIKVPFKASEIPSENRILWVDPRLEGAVQLCGDTEKPDEVTMVYTRDNAGLLKSTGAYYLVCPFSQDADRRVRYTDGWFDFSNGYTASGDERGNMMFMRNEWPCMPMGAYTESAETLSKVAAGFFALDSSRNGGGSLMTSAANGKSGLLYGRGTNVDSPIWALEPGSTVTIDTRLNGESVEMTDPFSGGRDVMSFNVNDGASLPVRVFGYGSPSSTSYANKEILGEWLFYSENVSAVDRERIEAYLAWKWQERFMIGYGETRDMAVSGAGTIAVANPKSLPTLAQGFMGVIELTKDDYAFTLPKEESEAVDAVKLPGRTVRMQGEVAIDLDVTAAKSGSYLLMSAADLAAGTTFTLGTVTDRKTREIVLSVRDNALYADVKPKGFAVSIR